MNLDTPSITASTAILQSDRIKRWLPIGLIMMLATGLLFYNLGTEGLWTDEFTSLEDAGQGKLWRLEKNMHRPLYYVLLELWMQFGHSDAWLRSLSVLFAIVSVFLLYQLGKRLAGEPTGLLAALFLAGSPLFINHGQEIRMYVMSLCLALGGTLALTQILQAEREDEFGKTSLAGWAILRLLATLTVPLNITLLLPDILLIWVRFRKNRQILFWFGQWLVLMLLLWSPFLLLTLQTVAPSSPYVSHHQGRVPPNLGNVVRTLKFWTVWPFAVQSNGIAAGFYKMFTLILAGLLGAALVRRPRALSQLWWAAVWFALPLVPIFVFSYLSTSLWVNRYLLFVLPYLCILLAGGLCRLWQQWKAAALVIGILYLVATSGGLVRYYTVQDRPDVKFMIQTIEQYEQPGDAIVWSHYYQKGLVHYYEGDLAVYWSPTLRLDLNNPADVEDWLDAFPTDQERWWLTLEVQEKDYENLKEAIKARYQIETSFDYEKGSRVLLLTEG